MTPRPASLELTGIRKRFESVAALDHATLTVREGTIHALLGENGAGKTRAPASTLSGGNQQRLLLARELDGNPALLVAMNPTRGLDIAATADVQWRFSAARDAGMGIVYYTADLDELLAVSDRILVVFDGRVREVARDRASVGRAMLGAA